MACISRDASSSNLLATTLLQQQCQWSSAGHTHTACMYLAVSVLLFSPVGDAGEATLPVKFFSQNPPAPSIGHFLLVEYLGPRNNSTQSVRGPWLLGIRSREQAPRRPGTLRGLLVNITRSQAFPVFHIHISACQIINKNYYLC